MKRRTFIGTSVAAALDAKVSWAAGMPKQVRPIGVQLYTVRDAMKTDFEGSIAKVAQIGYKEVEFAGYFDHSPKDISALLKKNGLTSPSCHVPYDTVDKKWPEQIEAAHPATTILLPLGATRSSVSNLMDTSAPPIFSKKPANSPSKPVSNSLITITLSNFSLQRRLAGSFLTTFSSRPIRNMLRWRWTYAGSALPARILSTTSINIPGAFHSYM